MPSKFEQQERKKHKMDKKQPQINGRESNERGALTRNEWDSSIEEKSLESEAVKTPTGTDPKKGGWMTVNCFYDV